MHMPQETQRSGTIFALPSSSESIALTPHASAQGRVWCEIASYGHTLLHLPHLMQRDWSMTALPLSTLMHCLGQTAVHGCATQPRQLSVT